METGFAFVLHGTALAVNSVLVSWWSNRAISPTVFWDVAGLLVTCRRSVIRSPFPPTAHSGSSLVDATEDLPKKRRRVAAMRITNLNLFRITSPVIDIGTTRASVKNTASIGMVVIVPTYEPAHAKKARVATGDQSIGGGLIAIAKNDTVASLSLGIYPLYGCSAVFRLTEKEQYISRTTEALYTCSDAHGVGTK